MLRHLYIYIRLVEAIETLRLYRRSRYIGSVEVQNIYLVEAVNMSNMCHEYFSLAKAMSSF